MNALLLNYLPLVVFIAVALVIGLALLIAPFIVAYQQPDPEKLSDKLKEIFTERDRNGVLREGTNEVEKTLFIKSPKSIRYGDVVKVIDAAKSAGASPIGLQVDDLSE